MMIARMHYAAGAFMAMLCIALSVYIWIKLDSKWPQYKLPPQIRVLPPRSLSSGK